MSEVAVGREKAQAGSPWSPDEYVVVADLYLRRGRSSGVGDPEVLDLATLTGRTPASISRRLGNFDGTAHPGRGLKPVTGEGLAIFRAMQGDEHLRTRIVTESRQRLAANTSPSTELQPIRMPRIVDPEDHRVERVEVRSEATVRELVRAEADLVRRYRAWIDPAGTRMRGIVIPVGSHNLRVDLYDTQLDLLIEAKGRVTRDLIREAVGQLIDYRRYLSPRPRLAILIPTEMDADLAGLLQEAGIHGIWATGDGFVDSCGGELVARTI